MVFRAGEVGGGVRVDGGGDFQALGGETGDVDGCEVVVFWD